ncbi:DeoR/GlpR family DNA-binding transcription regulator [Rhodococcus aerolatus]
MFAEERQQQVLALARRDGRVGVTDLAARLDVTPETIRRDLGLLEQAGVLRRVHGGAIPVERLGAEPGLDERDRAAAAEKDRIAVAALDQLAGARSLLLDAGSTTARLADLLPDDPGLTVFTNSPTVVTRLVTRPRLTVVLLGGRVRARTLAAVGATTLEQLERLHADVAVLGTNGVSVERGLTTPDPEEAAVKAAMVRAGRWTVALADSAKVGSDHLVRFAELRAVDVLVTDTGLGEDAARALTAAGPEVVRA